MLVLVALTFGRRALEPDVQSAAETAPALSPPGTPAAVHTHPAPQTHEGFLYGRIVTIDGATYSGRLRWGGAQEAFWSDYFNGAKDDNPWVAHVPPARLPKQRRSFQILGLRFPGRERQVDLGRLFMARFGDLARIEARGKDVRVTLKSGTVFDLDRLSASDFDDGVRVWDASRGIVDLDSLRIGTIELLPTPALGAAEYRLHGTVRTRAGAFTGFVQWNREACVGTDELHGRTDEGERLGLRFDTIRSIARRSHDSAVVTLLDGREHVLSGAADVGPGNRGTYVDDPRYGRVLVSWDAFERADFGAGGSGPAYGDFAPGQPLMGRVTTRAGERFRGRLVFDLDESETTETLDAPFQGVDYTIPFALVTSIAIPGLDQRDSGNPATVPPGQDAPDARHARVTLQSGELLPLERAGDLGERNAGLLIFVGGSEGAEYLSWSDVEQVEFGLLRDLDF